MPTPLPEPARTDLSPPDAAEAQVLALGATRHAGEGGDFRVYTDPAGHPFCFVYDA